MNLTTLQVPPCSGQKNEGCKYLISVSKVQQIIQNNITEVSLIYSHAKRISNFTELITFFVFSTQFLEAGF